MEHKELMIQLERLKQKQQKVTQACKKAGDKQLLAFFVEILPMALQAERCSIFVLDPVSENIWLECGTYVEERHVSVPIDESLVGRVISTGRSAIEEEMDSTVGAHGIVDMQTGFVTRNAVCVPIKGLTKARIAGAIEVLNKRGRGRFGAEDIELLERAAYQLQVNVENLLMKGELERLSVAMAKKIKILESKLGRL